VETLRAERPRHFGMRTTGLAIAPRPEENGVDAVRPYLARLPAFALLALSAAGAFAQIGFTGPSGSAPSFAPPPAATPAPQPPAPPPAQPRAASTPATTTPVAVTSQRDPHAFIPQVASGKIALAVSARYAADGGYIPRAMTWRVFAERPDGGNPLPIAEAQDAYPVFALDPGNYIV
jgi:hypothetical protein